MAVTEAKLKKIGMSHSIAHPVFYLQYFKLHSMIHHLMLFITKILSKKLIQILVFVHIDGLFYKLYTFLI